MPNDNGEHHVNPALKQSAQELPSQNQDDVERLKKPTPPSASRTEAPLKPDFPKNPNPDEDEFEEDDEGNLTPVEQ